MKTKLIMVLCITALVMMCGTAFANTLVGAGDVGKIGDGISPFSEENKTEIERAIFNEMRPVKISGGNDTNWNISGLHFKSVLTPIANAQEAWNYIEEDGQRIGFACEEMRWSDGKSIKSGANTSKGIETSNNSSPVVVTYPDALGAGIGIKIIQDNYRWQKIIEIGSLAALGKIPVDAEYLEISFNVSGDIVLPNGVIEAPLPFGNNSFLQPVRAWDSSPTPEDHDNEVNSGAVGVIADGVITKRIPVAWLKSAKYPVRTDATITYGAENVFNSASTSSISVSMLDSTHFVVAYKDSNGYGTAIVGVVSGTAISSYGAENVFNSATIEYPSVATLDATHFVVVYQDSNGYGTAIVGVVSGTAISSYGAENVFNSASTQYSSVASLDATHFVVAYRDGGNSDYGTAIIGLVSGTTISSYGAENVFNSASTQYSSVASLDSTHFAVAYQDGGNSDYGTAIIGLVSGTTISSYGAENVFNSASTIFVSVATLDATHFVVVYYDGGNSGYGTAIIGLVSGTTISSYGAENVFNSGITTDISVTALDSTYFVVAYQDYGNSGYGTAIIGLVSGTTISSYGAENVFNSASTIFVSVTALDSTHFVVAYRDSNYYGTAIVGSIPGAVTFIPPDPTTLANTTGNFWVNHTWSAGAGNVTDSYNVSINDTWYNTTTVAFYNDTYSPHAWQNATVYAYNSTAAGALSAGNVSQDAQIPNNPVTITNTSDWSGDAAENVYVDYDSTDADSDAPAFSCNRTDLFTDFDTANGTGNWTSVIGTYPVDFGVSDGYGSTSNYTMTVAVSAISITLHSSSPETIYTNHTGAITANYIVGSTEPLNLSSLAFLYGINYTITGDMHGYISAPSNSVASEGIYRAPNRNTTPYLSWEFNDTITGGNVWQWGGGDNESWWITKTPINATHTWVNATGIPEHVFQSTFYLKKLSMYQAPKTGFEINSQQGLIIKMWDTEVIRGRSIDYLMNMYFDTAWESTIPTDPIEIWYCNSSFNPDTDDPTGENCTKIVEWDGNRWANHSWVPGSNASYCIPLTINASGHAVTSGEINYIYLTSPTQSSKSYILNATNHDPGICNITYAQTETMWTYSELAGASSPVAYTPSFFTTFVRDDEEMLHHLYIANEDGDWAHSGIQSIPIGVSHFPVSAVSINYFNFTCPTFGYTHDDRMDATYDGGSFFIGLDCPGDPDGGIVSHNLTLHYANETIVAVINDTFTTTGDESVEINFTTTPYYSTNDAYTLKCVSTDDEGTVATRWLGSYFTLAADGTQGHYVNDYLMFWGMNDVPTLYAVVNNDSYISYDVGSDIYTMHVPFFKSKCNDTFRVNETLHLESLNSEDVAYFRFHGVTIFDNANIHGWDTVSDTAAPITDAYRGYLVAYGQTTGNITNSNLSYLGSDVYRQEGVNFVDNFIEYLIYNTTFSHNSRGLVLEECVNFNISNCAIHDNAETGIGIYYSESNIVENCTISDSLYDPGIYLYEAQDNIIRYNTISGISDSAIRIRENSNNNTLIGNDITGSAVYDYYFSSASIDNTIRDPASSTDKIRVLATSAVNIENTDNAAFFGDSSNSTYAYPLNFSMSVTGATHTFDITQVDITITPDTDAVKIWNLSWDKVVTFNASNVSGAPHVWFNITQPIWSNSNVSIYRNDSIYANETADASGAIMYNYSGGWSEHWFEFNPVNAAPDMPSVVTPADGATGTSTNPTLRVQVTDGNIADLLNVTFYTSTGSQIGSTQSGIANASTASVVWSGRSYSTTYYWYAIADDGTAQTQSDTWDFTTQSSGGGSSHVIFISGCNDWSGNAGNQVYIDFGCTGETAGATFTTDAASGSIDSSTGVYTWTTVPADAGVYTWRFNVENVYGISDYCDVTVTVYHFASPTTLTATTGNFWVDHTWGGNGFADSYNVSVNDVWLNNSAAQSSYHVRYPHAWSNISVAAFNDTTGLSSFVSNDVQVPNNAIVLTNYAVLMLAIAGENVSVDMNHEDLDGDVATYYCSRMDLFTDFSTADGTGQYTNAINGTHEVIFGVTDGYGWDNETITIEVGTVHPLELDEETPLMLFVVLVVLLFGSLFYIYHAASYVAKIVTALISTWMSFMLSNMAVSGNVVLNYAELSAGDVFIYGAHSIQIAALSHFFMFTGVVSALFMLVFAIKLVIDTYLDMQDKRKADEEWDGVTES